PLLFSSLEPVETQGTRHHHVSFSLLGQGQVAGRKLERELMIEAVSGGGAAAVPILQLRQLHVQQGSDRGDGGGVIRCSAFQGTAGVIGYFHECLKPPCS